MTGEETVKRLVIISAALLVSTSAFATPKPGAGNPHTPAPQVVTPAPTWGNVAATTNQTLDNRFSPTTTSTNRNDITNNVDTRNTNTNNITSQNTVRGGDVTNTVRGENHAYGGVGEGGQASNSTVVNANSYQAKQRLQAPGIAASFSSVAGNPCERAPFGIGGSMPGFGGLLQIPLESGECWQERKLNQGLILRQSGICVSDNAMVAVWAGNAVAVAIQNNPCQVQARRRVLRVKG
jgi:hypothetical protein